MKYPYSNDTYWENKIIAYLHDAPDKILDIAKHEERSSYLIEALDLQKPNKEEYKLADILAAGIERGLFPEHSNDPGRSGSVDFLQHPFLTHPISKTSPLQIMPLLNKEKNSYSALVHKELIRFLNEEKEHEPGLTIHSRKKSDEIPYTKRLFFYLYFLLRNRLASNNVAGLGAFWHRIPADSRIPDHSIWHHNALASALFGCSYDFETSMFIKENISNAGLLVFTITPVQGFIANARRLRDYWTGSVLLSWLAFEGIRWIMENFGPDHVLYPSIIDQPLVNIYLKQIYNFHIPQTSKEKNTIASFPNKFVALIPFKYAENIGKNISDHIKQEWEKIIAISKNYLYNVLKINEDNSKQYLDTLFKRQAELYWSFDWAVTKLINKKDIESGIYELIPPAFYQTNMELENEFANILKDKQFCSPETFSITYFYSISHTLAQSSLAAAKNFRLTNRKPEPGEKCSLCGEFEALHPVPWEEGMQATVYSNNIKQFWNQLGAKWPNKLDFSQEERKEHLCSLCFIKRGLYKCIEKEAHILTEVFNEQEGFPSSTELALTDYFERKNISKEERRKRAQKIHENDESIKDLLPNDKYYAILLMDGDNMGKLVSGEIIGATWRDAIQQSLVNKLQGSSNIESSYKDAWEKFLNKKRLLTPAIHEAISESLSDFALYCVAPTVEVYQGKLVYAGGDDVCAFFPLRTALEAALNIHDAYHHAFRYIYENNKKSTEVQPLSKEWNGGPGKLSLGLGITPGISISGALMLVHHKEDLRWCMKEAHRLLDDVAKEQNKRDSLALGLYKRSGGQPHIFVRKWREEDCNPWEALKNIVNAVKAKKNKQKGKGKEISKSLLYNIENFKPAIISILENGGDAKQKKENLKKLILSLINRSQLKAENPDFLAEQIVHLLYVPKQELSALSTDGLRIAAFLANS